MLLATWVNSGKEGCRCVSLFACQWAGPIESKLDKDSLHWLWASSPSCHFFFTPSPRGTTCLKKCCLQTLIRPSFYPGSELKPGTPHPFPFLSHSHIHHPLDSLRPLPPHPHYQLIHTAACILFCASNVLYSISGSMLLLCVAEKKRVYKDTCIMASILDQYEEESTRTTTGRPLPNSVQEMVSKQTSLFWTSVFWHGLTIKILHWTCVHVSTSHDQWMFNLDVKMCIVKILYMYLIRTFASYFMVRRL